MVTLHLTIFHTQTVYLRNDECTSFSIQHLHVLVRHMDDILYDSVEEKKIEFI